MRLDKMEQKERICYRKCRHHWTKETIEFLKEAEKTGIDAALVIVPFYVKPTQEGMYQHFKAIAESTELPIILYNVPGRAGVSIQPETIKRLTDVCPNIVGVKDAAGNWDQVTKEKILLPDDFMIYSGDDAFTLPVLAAGGVGVISVASHVIGEDLLSMIDAFEKIGATIMANACGPCIGQWKRVTDDPTRKNSIVTSFNRNFAKRADGNPNTYAFVASSD